MIHTEFDPHNATGRILLRPNASWTWRANLMLVYTLTAVSGALALGFLIQGYWMILLFTVVEMLLLITALYYCTRRTHRQEVITFSRHEVRIEQGHREPEVCRVFNRAFSAFHVQQPRYRWYYPRIGIWCHGQQLEVGEFLGAEEKSDLARELRRMIRAIDTLPREHG